MTTSRRFRHRNLPRLYEGDINAYIAAVKAASPLVFWVMDQGTGTSITDVTGNGYTGTFNNAEWASGGPLNLPASASFDGVDNHVERADAAAFDGTSIAVSAWVKCTVPNIVLARSDINAAFNVQSFYAYLVNDDTVAFRRYSGTNATVYTLPSGITVDDDQWHWYAWKYTSTAFTAACDGVDLGSTATTGTVNSSAQDLQAGARSDLGGVTAVIDGELACVAYWVDPTITIADMIGHYEAGVGT